MEANVRRFKLESLISGSNVPGGTPSMQVERVAILSGRRVSNIGICPLAWNNTRKLVLLPDKSLRRKLYAPLDEPALD